MSFFSTSLDFSVYTKYYTLSNNETMSSLTLSYLSYLKEKNSKEPQQ